MLFAEETESTKEIRRNICCKLAETLLYGCSDGRYAKPEVESSAKRLKAPYTSTGIFKIYLNSQNKILR